MKEFLKEVSIFSELKDEELNLLARTAHERFNYCRDKQRRFSSADNSAKKVLMYAMEEGERGFGMTIVTQSVVWRA